MGRFFYWLYVLLFGALHAWGLPQGIDEDPIWINALAAVAFILSMTGMFFYRLRVHNRDIATVWKIVFAVIVVEYIANSVYYWTTPDAREHGFLFHVIVGIVSLVFWLPMFIWNGRVALGLSATTGAPRR